MKVIPVILFAYARTSHLEKVLACLRENGVSMMYVFADGPKGLADVASVNAARVILRSIDWCEVKITERPKNLGLGRNVLDGISRVASVHGSFVVWEDDVVCVADTYAWLCAALNYYSNDVRVMSVTAWTHPRVTPLGGKGSPYFDGRAECLVWGSYARSWQGMNQTALEKMEECRRSGFAPNTYGADLPRMAQIEESRNIWAVRWLYHHFQKGGLCLRPSHSMVEHIGFDDTATNAPEALGWINSPLLPAAVPELWPEPLENPDCRHLWYAANPPSSFLRRVWRRLTGR